MTVFFHIEGRIGCITLARPKQLNAISSDLLDAFSACLKQAEASDIEVILLQAEGRAFCAGDDLTELSSQAPTLEYAQDFVARLQEISRQIMFGTKPVVCAAQGYIVGGGVAWPLNADFSIVADDAILFCPEASWGMFPSGGVTALLPACCGPAKANEIMWRGVRVNGSQLLKDGIVGQSVPASELAERARDMACEIADLPAASRQRMKALKSFQWRDRIEAAMKVETQYCIESALDPDMRAKVEAGRP
jgi:enoyl-CoA hydratase/carnithine racemase